MEKAVETGSQIQNKLSTDDTLTIWGLVFEQANNPYQMLMLAQSKGAGNGVSPDGLHVDGYLNNEKWVETLQWWYNLFNKWEISPKGVSFNQAASMFSDGKIAMFVGGTWDILTFEKAAAENGLDYDIVPIPAFAGGTPVTPTNSFHLGINAYGNHKDIAMELIEYLTRGDIQEDWFRATAQLVANKSMLNVVNNDSYYSNFPWTVYSKVVVSELDETAQPRPSTPFYGEWENLVKKAFTDVSNGTDPKETLDSYTDIIERTAQKYR